ncbi:hypothetical protein GCM10027169_26850 [Gordonia jinhuaensis]|uniref:Cyclic pyranopterin monophosphate synthase n=1 Tax=Gordonia jinhuaensis TaxID=1517702 RepID=A0A916TBS8_9ACTN|nr:hypothetical protein GCM10011489_26720 [Gordonia jinhuaensis]
MTRRTDDDAADESPAAASGVADAAAADESSRGRLTHLDADGAAHMVDVSHKTDTRRRALAAGTFHTTAQVIDLLVENRLPKGDVLATARIAGIMGAKQTSSLIPLCHQLALASVAVDFDVHDDRIDVLATVTTTDRTGVEMEALTAVSVAGLTLHDMCKALDPRARMDNVRLLEKDGGKRGHWRRDGSDWTDDGDGTHERLGARHDGADRGGADRGDGRDRPTSR